MLGEIMWPPEVKSKAMLACGRCCCLCHKFAGVGIECHHIDPKAKGGEHTFENCIPLCFDCHAEVGHYNDQHPKGTKFSPEELRGHRDRWYMTVQKGKPSDSGRIDYPEEERILVHIAKAGPKEADELIEPLGISKIKAEFCCGRLEEIGYLDRYAVWINRRPFYLIQRAKEYLITKKLVE